MTQKELFLKAVTELNSEALEYILSEDITYFGATKQTFTDRMAYIFNQVKLGGNNQNLKIKESKKNPNTYYLQLVPFSQTLVFIISETNDVMTNVYNNRKIKTNADAENVTPLDLYFGYDELADFEPTENYLITQHHCDQVVSEFNTSNHPLTMNDLKNWLETHDLLYKSVEDKYMYFKFNDFKHLYFRQKYLFEKLLHYKEAKQAIIEYYSDEYDGSAWLSKYHRLAFCKALQFNDEFKEHDKENKIVKSFYRPYKLYQGEEFIFLIEFGELYYKLFDS